jgi:hypothetical protein
MLAIDQQHDLCRASSALSFRRSLASRMRAFLGAAP